MRKIVLLIIILMLIPGVSGYECWKGLDGTEKEGQYGTMQAGGFVPYSVNVACTEYQAWVFAQPLYLEPEERRAIKETYLQTMSEIESAKTDLATMRNQTTMTEAQQTNNIRKLADYEYKIFDILGTILRFLKLVFWSN